MLARTCDRLRVTLKRRQIIGKRADLERIAESGVGGDQPHRRADSCFGSERGDLPCQIALLLAGKVWDTAIRRPPCIGLMTNDAWRIQARSVRRRERRLCTNDKHEGTYQLQNRGAN